jgi:hypothetical protein
MLRILVEHDPIFWGHANEVNRASVIIYLENAFCKA